MTESGLILNRYWNNHTQSVAFEPLEKIARALGVNPGDLIMVVEDSIAQTEDSEKAVA